MTLDKIQKFYLENGNTQINPKCIYYNESINKLFISSINDGDGGEFFDLNNNTSQEVIKVKYNKLIIINNISSAAKAPSAM